MGAWSVDAHGNDDAVDWAYELEEAEDLTPVEAAIQAVLSVGEDYLEAPEATIALAAIEVLARLTGNWGERNSYTETIDKWVEQATAVPTREILLDAQSAIDRILGENSELRELWEDSDDYDAWVQSVQSLRSRVGA